MSTLTISNLSDGTTTVPTTYITNGSARAWLSYNHAGSSIRDSFGVSSVTDNATGHFTKNYTSSMSSANHVIGADGQETGGSGPTSDRYTCMARGASRISATSAQFTSGDRTSPNTARDQNFCLTVSHGDLA